MSPVGVSNGAGPDTPPDTTACTPTPDYPGDRHTEGTVMSYIETHDVVGMTCDHCVRAVRAEVSAIEGVTNVDVDLIRGVVHVTAEQPVRTTALREAVEEAGYALA